MSTASISDGPFDLSGALPDGVTVLEASAGTGKTFTIAALATRFVAAGTPLERLLLVTFTRMATGELRERVRERLVRTERALAQVLAGAPTPADEVSALLGTGPPRRGRRTARAAGPSDRELRRGDDRHHALVLPGGARRAGDARRSRARRELRREHRRSRRGGDRRPLCPPLLGRERGRAVRSGTCGADRPDRDRCIRPP